MKKCDEVISKLEDYIDKELTPEEENEITAHIESCPSCKNEFDFAIAVRKALKNIEMPPAPADFAEKVNKAIDENPRKSGFSKIFARRIVSTVAACLVFAVVLSVNNKEELTDNIKYHDVQNTAGSYDNTILSKDIQKNEITPSPIPEAETPKPQKTQQKGTLKKSSENKTADIQQKETIPETTPELPKSEQPEPNEKINENVFPENDNTDCTDSESVNSMSLPDCGAALSSENDNPVNQVRLMKGQYIQEPYYLYVGADCIDKVNSAASDYGTDKNGFYVMDSENYAKFIAYINTLEIEFTAPNAENTSEILLVIEEK